MAEHCNNEPKDCSRLKELLTKISILHSLPNSLEKRKRKDEFKIDLYRTILCRLASDFEALLRWSPLFKAELALTLV